MIACFIMLAFRDDGERIVVSDDKGNAILQIEENTEMSLFICMDEAREEEPPLSISPKGLEQEEPIELIGPRPLDLPTDIAARHNMSMRQKCSVSSNIIHESGDDIEIPAPAHALVIAAVSSLKYSIPPLCLFLAFLATILTGFGLLSDKPSKRNIRFKRYDGILGFIIALISALVIAYASTLALPPESSLFPGYFEMMIMVASNFVAFLATYLVIAAIRSRQKPVLAAPHNATTQELTSSEPANVSIENNQTDETEQPDKTKSITPKFKPWISLALGPALAITAAIIVSFAPLPGLSTLEMASQLISTRFMSAFFAVLAGVGEECLFRGLIQSSLEARDDSKHPLAENIFAIAVATTLFVGLHVPQSLDHLWALIPIGCVSILSGFLKIRYKSLYPCILLHMSYNATLLIPSILV